MKKLTFLIAALLFALGASAQRDIITTLCFSDSVKFPFSSEWQYLSTDIYLFNGEKFSKLINEVNFESTEKKRRKNSFTKEELEYLLITAQLKDVKFFGDKDIAYPLYNFQINRDKDNKYQTFVSDKIDKIRIIDNLPLYSAADKIDAEIKVRAITSNNKDQLIAMVASQLQTIAKIPTPTGAIFSLLNEFGNFLEANSKKKEYRFSSTIRLFEQKNFDTRLHSIRVYALNTANSEPILLNSSSLKTFLDTSFAPEITRDGLEQMLSYTQYPLIVVANYKSLYRMEQIRGDEVNQANIDKRKLRIENDFKSGLINAETYRQEKDFISFLTVFANLKNMMETYTLNYRMGNPNAITNGLLKVMQSYRQLLKFYDEVEFKYRNSSTFLTVFKSEYTSILGFAGLYLEDDQNLKQTKNMVKTMVDLEKDMKFTDTYICENYLRNLHFSDIFNKDEFSKTIEGIIINNQIALLEKFILEKNFSTDIVNLSKIKAIPQNVSAPEKLKEKSNNTSCISCRELAQSAIKEFYDNLTEYNKVLALKKHDSIVVVAENKIFGYLDKAELIEKNIKLQYKDSLPASVNFLYNKLLETKRDMQNLDDFTKIIVADKSLNIINELNSKLLSYMLTVEDNFAYIESRRPDFIVVPIPVHTSSTTNQENEAIQVKIVSKDADEDSQKPKISEDEKKQAEKDDFLDFRLEDKQK